MTLKIFDSTTNKAVEDVDPVLFEFNGTVGGEKVVLLKIENITDEYVYRDVIVSVADMTSTDFMVGETMATLGRRVKIGDLEPYESRNFMFKAVVKPNTPMKNVVNNILRSASVRYEVDD